MPTTPTSPEPFITVDALAQILGVPRSWVYEASARGRIPSYKVGHYIRFRLSEVEGALAKRSPDEGGPRG